MKRKINVLGKVCRILSIIMTVLLIIGASAMLITSAVLIALPQDSLHVDVDGSAKVEVYGDLIDMIPEDLFLFGNPGPATLSIMDLLQNLDVTFIFNARMKEITKDGVVYTDKDGVDHLIECESAINALGMTYDQDAVDELLDVVPRSYAMGDCSGKAMTIQTAVLDGFAMAMDV